MNENNDDLAPPQLEERRHHWAKRIDLSLIRQVGVDFDEVMVNSQGEVCALVEDATGMVLARVSEHDSIKDLFEARIQVTGEPATMEFASRQAAMRYVESGVCARWDFHNQSPEVQGGRAAQVKPVFVNS